MQRDYNDFLAYLTKHLPEMQYDISRNMQSASADGVTLSKEDLQVVTQVALQAACSALRQYHNWLHEKAT